MSAVEATAATLVRAFGSGDIAGYFAHFDPDATFVFYTTANRLESRAAYEAEWVMWEREDDFRVLSCESSARHFQDFGDVVVFSHDVKTVVSSNSEEQTLFERETIVFRRVDDRWHAVHEHLSPNPMTRAVDQS